MTLSFVFVSGNKTRKHIMVRAGFQLNFCSTIIKDQEVLRIVSCAPAGTKSVIYDCLVVDVQTLKTEFRQR